MRVDGVTVVAAAGQWLLLPHRNNTGLLHDRRSPLKLGPRWPGVSGAQPPLARARLRSARNRISHASGPGAVVA